MPDQTVLSEFVGVVGRPLGTDGTISIVDAPPQSFAIAPGMAVAVGYSREFVNTYHVRAYAEHGTRRRISLVEVQTAAEAALLSERAIYALPSTAEHASSERYAISELLQCSVIDENGALLGVVTDVWLLPANDVWEVTTPSGKTIPIPVIDDVVKNVNLASKTIAVVMMDGLDLLSSDSPSDDTDA